MEDKCDVNEEDNICICGSHALTNEFDKTKAIFKYGTGLSGTIFKSNMSEFYEMFLRKSIPDGIIVDWVGDDPPPKGWLECNGYIYSPETYPTLHILLNENILLPEIKGRVCVHVSDDVNSDFYGNVGDHIHDITLGRQLTKTPQHRHQVFGYKLGAHEKLTKEGGGRRHGGTKLITMTTESTGGGSAWYHLQQSYTVRKIIKATPIYDQYLTPLPHDPNGGVPPNPFPPIVPPDGGNEITSTPSFTGDYDYLSGTNQCSNDMVMTLNEVSQNVNVSITLTKMEVENSVDGFLYIADLGDSSVVSSSVFTQTYFDDSVNNPEQNRLHNMFKDYTDTSKLELRLILPNATNSAYDSTPDKREYGVITNDYTDIHPLSANDPFMLSQYRYGVKPILMVIPASDTYELSSTSWIVGSGYLMKGMVELESGEEDPTRDIYLTTEPSDPNSTPYSAYYREVDNFPALGYPKLHIESQLDMNTLCPKDYSNVAMGDWNFVTANDTDSSNNITIGLNEYEIVEITYQ
jgi:microcystin-dependent protein